MITPTLKAPSFSDLDPGDVFVALLPEKYIGMKVRREVGDEYVLMLGPDGDRMHRILEHGRPQTLLSFGKGFVFKLPIDLDAWSEQAPRAGDFAVAVYGEEVFMRAVLGDNGRRPTYVCFVRLRDGMILTDRNGDLVYRLPDFKVAYTTSWSIVLPDEPKAYLTLSACNPSPGNAASSTPAITVLR